MTKNLKPDVILKNFWRNNDRFADVFNGVLFGGKKVILPENLEEMDTDVSNVVSVKGYAQTLTRSRDVIKKMAYGIEFVLLGMES